jgi:predicted CXXCH cytochrome family protein
MIRRSRLWRCRSNSTAVFCASLLAACGAIAAEAPEFVGSATCGSCHAAELEAWSDSHHSWALRPATAETVLGDFDVASIAHKGRMTRFLIDDGRYFVETDGPDGELATYEVKYVVGVSPLQQYLVELDGGRLQALDFAWDADENRWFHLYPDDDVSPGNGLHWTGFYKNWQARCAVCHQTDFRKNYDPAARSYASQWSELTIGCEACHGPGEAHVAWAERPQSFDAALFAGVGGDGLLMPNAGDRQAAEEAMCGPCHARREALGPNSTLPTAPLSDHYVLSTLRDGLYFADGQQDEEVYILGSFLQSKMHQKGVTCGDCHDPHSGRLLAEGNAVCTQCHNEDGRTDFPTLKLGLFDSPDHHHHAPGSEAAECVSCHMPERNYMVIDGRRDHFFRVPDPLLSERVGAPDACLSCHDGRGAEWAAAHVAEWAPGATASGSAYGETFWRARSRGLNSATVAALAELARDASHPAIVRATAVDEIAGRADVATATTLAGLLSDESDRVRAAAVRLWRSAPAAERVDRLEPLLDDPVASVRIATALELANVAPEDLPEERRAALQDGLAELRASMLAEADFPEGQMAIGGLAMAIRNWPAAEAAFAEAVFMDPQLVEAWLARARIAAALGNVAEATAILTAARASNPDDPDLAAQLSQALLSQGRVDDAIPILRDVVAARPDDREARIALASVLLQMGDLAAAGAEIDRLRIADPTRAEVLVLHGLRQVFTGDLAGARETVAEIRQRYPLLRLPPQLEAVSRMP